MLRITLLDELQQVTLKLEGCLAGFWVKETETAWRSAQSGLERRPLVVDMKAVDRVDQAGAYLLALLYQQGVRFIASGTAMTELVRSIAEEWPQPSLATRIPAKRSSRSMTQTFKEAAGHAKEPQEARTIRKT